jgi:hypothetical protein
MAAPAPGPAGRKTRWPELVGWDLDDAAEKIKEEWDDVRVIVCIPLDSEPPAGHQGVVSVIIDYNIDEYGIPYVPNPLPPRIQNTCGGSLS